METRTAPPKKQKEDWLSLINNPQKQFIHICKDVSGVESDLLETSPESSACQRCSRSDVHPLVVWNNETDKQTAHGDDAINLIRFNKTQTVFTQEAKELQ